MTPSPAWWPDDGPDVDTDRGDLGDPGPGDDDAPPEDPGDLLAVARFGSIPFADEFDESEAHFAMAGWDHGRDGSPC